MKNALNVAECYVVLNKIFKFNFFKRYQDYKKVIFTQICIPTIEKEGLNSNISLHFGKTPYFAFLKEKNGEIEDINFIESKGKHMGGSLTPAEIILNSDANILICGNLGSKAVNMLQKNNVKVFSGANGSVKDIFEQWKSGNLDMADKNSCSSKRVH